MSVFTIDLSSELTFDTLREFLKLNDREQDRPQESPVLDFKEDFPPDLADDVCAFANSYGGVILLGVKGKKGHPLAIPESIVGIPGKAGEISQRVVNIILNGVQPRPRFSVGVVALPQAPDKFVAVVRIEAGEDTPYMWLGKNRISVRVEDSSRAASLEQVKDLVRSGSGPPQSAEELLDAGDPYVLVRSPVGEHRSGNFHQLIWAPTHAFRVRLDRAAERQFRDFVAESFTKDRTEAPGISISRTANYTDVDVRNQERDFHRKWRLTNTGVVGFTSNVGYLTPGALSEKIGRIDEFGYWIADSIAFLRLVKGIAQEHGYYGFGLLRHTLSIASGMSINLKMSMPGPGYEGEDNMVGVRVPVPLPSLVYPSTRTEPVNVLHLTDDDIATLVSDSFLHHCRSLGGDVDWPRLHEQVRYLLNVLYPEPTRS